MDHQKIKSALETIVAGNITELFNNYNDVREARLMDERHRAELLAIFDAGIARDTRGNFSMSYSLEYNDYPDAVGFKLHIKGPPNFEKERDRIGFWLQNRVLLQLGSFLRSGALVFEGTTCNDYAMPPNSPPGSSHDSRPAPD